MNKWLLPTLLSAVSIVVVSGQAQERNRRPDAGSSPTIVKRQLSNGLAVWIVEQHELPVVQMSLQVPTGTDADPPGRYGIGGVMLGAVSANTGRAASMISWGTRYA